MLSDFELVPSGRFGPSLVALRAFDGGAVALRDAACFLSFHTDLALPPPAFPEACAPLDGLRCLVPSHTAGDPTPEYVTAAAAAFAARYRLGDGLLAAAGAVLARLAEGPCAAAAMYHGVMEMGATSAPFGRDSMALHAAMLHLAQSADAVCTGTLAALSASGREVTKGEATTSPADDERLELAAFLLSAVLAAKTNAHRGTDGAWCMFPWASKLAHSCDPSCAFVPSVTSDGPGAGTQTRVAAFVTLRPVAPGEALTFSYLGGPALHLSSAQRQQRLLKSHMFVCRCARCDGLDLAAPFVGRCDTCATDAAVWHRRGGPLAYSALDCEGGRLYVCASCHAGSPVPPALTGDAAVFHDVEVAARSTFADALHPAHAAAGSMAARARAARELLLRWAEVLPPSAATVRHLGRAWWVREAAWRVLQFHCALARTIGALNGDGAPQQRAFDLCVCWWLRFQDGGAAAEGALALGMVEAAAALSVIDVAVALTPTPGFRTAVTAAHLAPLLSATAAAVLASAPFVEAIAAAGGGADYATSRIQKARVAAAAVREEAHSPATTLVAPLVPTRLAAAASTTSKDGWLALLKMFE